MKKTKKTKTNDGTLPVGGHAYHPTIGIFGMSGAGKTSLAATALKPLFADSNEGTMSLDHVPELAHVRRRRVQNIKSLNTIYDNLTGTGDNNWKGKFGTLVLDHFDDIQQIILAQLADKAAEMDSREEPDMIDQREWGIMANKLRRYLRMLKGLPMTKILIMGEKYMEQEGWMYPSLQGQMRDQIPYFCDHVIYLRVNDKGVRYMQLDPKPGEYYAKTRARWLAPDERKIRYDLDNYTALADLIEMIRVGPARKTKKSKKSK